MDDPLSMLAIWAIGLYWLGKHFLNKNPQITDAANKAASDKVLALIHKFLK
jgi:hypothetical protein